MKKPKIPKPLAWFLVIYWLGITSAFSETLVLHSGKTVDGTIIQTNNGEFLVLYDYGTFVFAETSIKEIKQGEPIESEKVGRLPSFRTIVLALSQQAWCSNLTQIPATVIDNGVYKNVPYTSFRCSDDYEINIYGDLKDPAAVEAGVYRKLLGDENAKRNCLNFISGLLPQAEDKKIVQSLNSEKDIKEQSGMSFEITPPDAEDAYLGWWISVCSVEKLNRSRATEKEIAAISVSKSAPTPTNAGSWSSSEIKLSRPYRTYTPQPTRPPAQVTPAQRQPNYGYSGGSSSRYAPSSSDRVYVRGYTKKDGTYVQPHTRSAPRRK